MRLRWHAAVLAALVGLSACGTAGSDSGAAAVQPREGRSGLQLSGAVAGRQVAVNDGLPQLVVGDCDPPDGGDSDICMISRTIDGRLFVLSMENPAVIEEGARLDVADPGCGSPQLCDAVTDVAIVDVQLDTGRRMRATGGSLQIRTVERFQRYSGSMRLELSGGGAVSGAFEVVPRPDDE